MKKLFIAAVLGLDAMYRFWEKIKDVRESFVESKRNDLDDRDYTTKKAVEYQVASDEQAVREKT